MKKTALIIMFAFAIVSLTQAQNVKVGIKGGYGFSHAWDGIDSDMKPSYKMGVITDFSLSKYFSIQPSLYFTNRGYEEKHNGFKYTSNANYIELPVAIAYKMHLGSNVRLGISIGPYIACGVGGKTEISGNGINEDWKTFDDVTINGQKYDAAERFDWGATAGVNLELLVFEISANYDLGLSDVYSMEKEARKEHMKNGMFWVALGIKL